jgi:NAD(P)-dependent dehydrogenase (short-subunit alcohol dehydrogenase family)
VKIKDKTAIVTGAGGDGSGRAIACRLAQDGALVVVSDINEAGCEETVRLVERAGGRAVFRRTDVRVEEEIRDLIDFAEKTFGTLNILINNASAPFHPGDPLQHWSDTIQTDFLGMMDATRLAIEAMKRAGGGAIVNMSSISALWHGRKGGSPAYDTAKAGVIRLTTTLAWLKEKENIRVNCLAPGWIASGDVRSYWESLTPEQRIERQAPARLLQLDEVAGAVVKLATDETLYGRILIWWSEDAPRFIQFGDRGYANLVDEVNL